MTERPTAIVFAPEAADEPSRETRRLSRLLVVALVLTGLTMRTAVTSVGAALDRLQSSMGFSGGVAGVITTLPVICFAAMGAATPRLAHRIGRHRLLVLALVAMTVGLVLRVTTAETWIFVIFSCAALLGGAICNVLLPGIVKTHFPSRVGRMTAVYVTALSVGQAAGSGLTIPIGDVVGGWRGGLGFWALLAAVAIVPWLPTLKHDRPGRFDDGPELPSARRLARSPTAWALTVMFAFQSMQAYIAFGWFAKLLSSSGLTEARAGWMVAILTAMGIPMSLLAPQIPQRFHRHLVVIMSACGLVAYCGLWFDPTGAVPIWMILDGINMGMFPLALTLIVHRSAQPESTAALSGFVQSIGYAIAGTGPLLFGVLHSSTGDWHASLVVVFIAAIVTIGAAWRATAQRWVDDELTSK